jgi:hypothetical protein
VNFFLILLASIDLKGLALLSELASGDSGDFFGRFNEPSGLKMLCLSDCVILRLIFSIWPLGEVFTSSAAGT